MNRLGTMRYFLLFFFISITQLCFAQNADSVSKILIRYGTGYNSFGKRGIYSRYEVIELTKFNQDEFKASKYIKITGFDNGDSSKLKKDTTSIKTMTLPAIAKSKIEKLITALNTTKDNFNAEFLMQFVSRPNPKEILKAARQIEKDYLFTDSNSEKEDRRKWFREMNHFKDLNLFLNKNKPDPNFIYVVSDAWDFMELSFVSGKDTIRFGGQLFQLAGQPIEIFKRNSHLSEKRIVNLEVNMIITNLLPKNSLLRKAISLEALKEKYLEWYIENNIQY